MVGPFVSDGLDVITCAESLTLKNKCIWGTEELDILDEL